MADSFAFDKDAKDGDTVTLENGVTYQYEEAKDRWLVQSVGGASGDFLQKWAMQLRGTFELDADGKVIIPDDVIYESDNDPDAELYADYKRAGVWWTNSTINTGYLPKYTNRLLIASNTYLDAELEGDRWIYLEKEMQPVYEVGDYIRVRTETLGAYNDGTEAEFIQDSLDNIWKITKVLEINNDTGFSDRWLGMQAFEVEKCLDERFYYGSYNISQFEDYKQFAPCRVSQSVYAPLGDSDEKVIVGAFRCAPSDGSPPILDSGQMIFSSPWGTLDPSEMMSLRISTLDSRNEPIPDGHFETNKEFELYRSRNGLAVKVATFSPYSVSVNTYSNGGEYIELGLDTNKTNVIEGLEEGVDYFLNDNVREEYASKEYVDSGDQRLDTRIDELEQEIDIIAPRLESASYTYSDSPAVKAGEMHIASGAFTSGTDVILFNDVALDGKTHTWAELAEGDYLEITDVTNDTRTADNYAMYLVTKAPEGSGMKQIEVALVKGQGAPTAGDVLDAKGFQLGGNDINDLDARYALKDHTHEELEGGYIVTPLVFPRLSGSQYASDDSIKSLNQYGSPTSGDAYGLDIPWAWFEKNYPDIIGWVDDGGPAKWQDSDGRLSINTGQSRPGLTVKGDWGYRTVDVTIPGFVIHVDKMEEPQWHHKWPEKEQG